MPGVWTWFGRRMDQDWVDSANGFWSVLLLAVCSVGAFIVRFVTEPITCFPPAQFTDEQVVFARQTCFMKDTYYTPLTEKIPTGPDREEGTFFYHLWIPIILFFQALCFKIPNVIWNLGKEYLTINLDDTVDSLKQAQVNSVETRKSVFHDAARVISKRLEGNKFLLTTLYLVVKLLFCLNLIGQFVFLTIHFRNTLAITAGSYVNFEIESIIKPLLAKVVICDFAIRKMQAIQRYSVQCTLPVTEIYEKLFVFLWWWVFLLTVVTIFNLLLWAGFLFIPFLRNKRISTNIKALEGPSHDSSLISRFISGFLGVDGVLVLSMISRNSSEMVTANLSQQLYQGFLESNRSGAIPQEDVTVGASAPVLGAENVPMEEKPPLV